ncbi:hypothetical protein Tco_0267847 [Tanacetum coccineum]
MGTPTQVCVRSCPNISAPAGRPFRMSTLVFVDPESSTQADGAQSSRVPMPLPEDPYKAIRTARMVVCVPHAMSSGHSASMAKVAAMSESAFLNDSEEEDDEEDEEIEESMDSDSLSEDTKDEGPTAKDEDPAAEDEGLTARVEGPGIDDESYGLDNERHGMDDDSHGLNDEGHSVESDGLDLEEEEEVVPGGQQQAALVVGIAVSAPLGLGYEALRCRELALEEDDVYRTFEVGQDSGSAPDFKRPERVSASRSGAVREEIFSQRYRFRSLEYEQERVAMTFRAIWRPMLAPESWAGQTDAWRAAMWHAISDVQGENQDLRLQLAEERRVRLELVEVVDDMRRGKEPKGDA